MNNAITALIKIVFSSNLPIKCREVLIPERLLTAAWDPRPQSKSTNKVHARIREIDLHYLRLSTIFVTYMLKGGGCPRVGSWLGRKSPEVNIEPFYPGS